MPLYFGLGNATKVDQIEVPWPSGKRQTLADKIPLNALLTVSEATR